MRLMDNPEHSGVLITPLPEPDVTRGTTHQGASVRRPLATGTIGRHRWRRTDWYGPPLRHGIRLCLLPGYGQDRPFASRSPPLAEIIMRSDTANNLVGY